MVRANPVGTIRPRYQFSGNYHGGKHSRKPGEGQVNFGKFSSLKKLARAIARDKLPPELDRKIKQILATPGRYSPKQKWVII